MANKTRTYLVKWCWKIEGNRTTPEEHHVAATTVQRAISKTVKDINDGKWEAVSDTRALPEALEAELGGDDVRASDLMVVEVSPVKW